MEAAGLLVGTRERTGRLEDDMLVMMLPVVVVVVSDGVGEKGRHFFFCGFSV